MVLQTTSPQSITELLKSVSIHVSGRGEFAKFKRLYRNDRIAFVYDILPALARTIAPYQEEILGYFDIGYTRVAVRGPHGLGKTALASILVHHGVLTAESDCKVPTTASAWRQLEKYLWPEIHKTARFLDWIEIGREMYNGDELLVGSIKLERGLIEAFAVASDDHTTLEGAHATRIIYVFDEAKTIPSATWDAAEGAFATEGLEVSEYQKGYSGNILQGKSIIPTGDKAKYEYNPQLEERIKKLIERDPSITTSGIVLGYTGDKHTQNKVSKDSRIKAYTTSGLFSINDENRKVVGSSVDTLINPKVSPNTNSDTSEISEKSEKSEKSGHFNRALPELPLSEHEKESLMNSHVSDGSEVSHITRVPKETVSRVTYNPHASDSIHVNTRELKGTLIVPRDYMRKDAIEDHRDNNVISTSDTIYEAIAFAISTPGDPSGRFYDIHMQKPGYEDWKVRHVTLDEAIRAGRISATWAEQRARQWGIDSAVYQNRVLGEFADNTEDGIIPLSWIRMACDRWRKLREKDFASVHGEHVLGVDVARGGEDKTVIAERIGATVLKLHIFSKLLTTSTAGHVKLLAKGAQVNIEVDGGLGAAVYDMLKEQDIDGLRPIVVSGRTVFRDKSKELSFMNVRAAMWWHMRELLDPTYGSEIALPDVEELVLDLSTPRWIMLKDATVKLESKDEIEKRIGRSTDYGDAVCLSFWKASSGGGVIF